MPSPLSLLTTRRFLPLFCTQFLGAFNDNVFKNALVILITYIAAEQTGVNAQVLVTMAAGLFILPFFLFSATAGQLADKYEKSRLIRMTKVMEIVLMSVAGIGFYLHHIWMLMVVLFMVGTQATLFGPLKYSVLPDHLEENELISGNAMVEAGTFLAILLGTILGGLLILADGGVAYVAAIILGLALLGWLASWYIPSAAPSAPNLHVSWNIAAETWRIIGYSRVNKDVFLSIIGISWFWLVGATFLSQFPNFAKVTLHAGAEVVTFFLTLFSVGIGIGSMLCNRLLKGEITATYVPYGALGMALFTVALYVACQFLPTPDVTTPFITFREFIAMPSHWPVCLTLLGTAICGGIYIVPLYTIMQARSEHSHRARVVAANNVLNALFMVASAIGTLVLFEIGVSVVEVFLLVAMVNFPVAWQVNKLVKHRQSIRKGETHAG